MLAEVPKDPQTVLELLLWSRANGDREVRRHLAERYRILDEAGGEFFNLYLELTGRRMRRGFTAELLSATIQDVSQIIALREAGRGTYTADHLAALYRLIFEYMTCFPPDRRSPPCPALAPLPANPAPSGLKWTAARQVWPTSMALMPSPMRNRPPRP